MKRSSIFFTITLSFIISLFLVTLSYIILHQINERKALGERIGRYQPVARMLRRAEENDNFSPNVLEDLKALGFKLIKDKNLVHKLKQHQDIKKAFEPPEIRRQHRGRGRGFSVYKKDGSYYIYVKGKYLLQDVSTQKDTFIIYITLAFLLVFVVLIGSFLVTIKKLKPLKTLQEKIKLLGEDDLTNLPEITDKQDEVSLLSNEFVKSAQKLQKLRHARNVFIRNIMHELKTPIMKGKLLLELGVNKQKMGEIFIRLESLINEFALIESAVSKTDKIKKQNFYIDDIIDNVEDMLLVEDDSISREFGEEALNVNFKYFSLAVKNLIDNALKYSPDKKATIKNQGKNLIIQNQGAQLTQPIEEYKEPFGGIEEGAKNSFGLGLYIVHNLLGVNGYKLEYSYENGVNSFICVKI